MQKQIDCGFGVTLKPVEKEFYKGSEKYKDYEIKNSEVNR
jgi:hypothetical protein